MRGGTIIPFPTRRRATPQHTTARLDLQMQRWETDIQRDVGLAIRQALKAKPCPGQSRVEYDLTDWSDRLVGTPGGSHLEAAVDVSDRGLAGSQDNSEEREH